MIETRERPNDEFFYFASPPSQKDIYNILPRNPNTRDTIKEAYEKYDETRYDESNVNIVLRSSLHLPSARVGLLFPQCELLTLTQAVEP